MNRKIILFAILQLTVGCVLSQVLPEGMVSLLPDGVTANISNATVGMKPKDLVVAGDATNGYLGFFAATNAANGEELWVTDGTPEGTQIVKDINPGSTGSNVEYLTRFNNKVVFAANDGTKGTELWISDGTAGGTFMLKDIHTSGSSDPRGFTQLNETQFIFVAKNADSASQTYLYVSDGTTHGTQLIYECDARFPGAEYLSSSYVTPFCRVGRKVFFKAFTSAAGEELWVTDGTTLGTKLVKDINPGTANSVLNQFVNFYNEKLFFKANDGTNGHEPWASDGTETGTYLIKDTKSGAENGGVSTPTIKPYKGKVYFRGYDPTKGIELAATNLEQNDFHVFDINLTDPTASNNSTPDTGIEFDSVLFFSANAAGSVGIETHYCDGNSVTLHSNRAPTANFFLRDQVVVSGSLYWFNGGGPNTSTDYQQLFRLNSKTDGMTCVTTNFYTDKDNHYRFHSLRNLGGDLLVAAFPVTGGVGNSNTSSLYVYQYRKPDYNPVTDLDDLEMEFRTRLEIITSNKAVKDILVEEPRIIVNNSVLGIQANVENAIVMIYDAMGSKIASKIMKNGSIEINLPFVGVYMVSIESGDNKWVKKIINSN